MFGHPNNRLRSWRICYNKNHLKWSCRWNLQQLAHMILSREQVSLDFSVYFRRLRPMEATREPDLTEFLGFKQCQSYHRETTIIGKHISYQTLVQGLRTSTWRSFGVRFPTRSSTTCQPTLWNVAVQSCKGGCCLVWPHPASCGYLMHLRNMNMYQEWANLECNYCHCLVLSNAGCGEKYTAHKIITVAPRSEKAKRLMSSEEQMAALGYPCLPEIAFAADVDPRNRNIMLCHHCISKKSCSDIQHPNHIL